MQRAIVIAICLVWAVGPCFARVDYRERLVVNVDGLMMRTLPSPSAPTIPGTMLERGTDVQVVEDKGSWVKISVRTVKEQGWVRFRQLINADPSKIRSEENTRTRGLERLFQGTDQSGYGSAAAARGISSLGKKMQQEDVFSAEDARRADKVTAFRISGVPATADRKARAAALRQKLDTFLREGGLGDYLP